MIDAALEVLDFEEGLGQPSGQGADVILLGLARVGAGLGRTARRRINVGFVPNWKSPTLLRGESLGFRGALRVS